MSKNNEDKSPPDNAKPTRKPNQTIQPNLNNCQELRSQNPVASGSTAVDERGYTHTNLNRQQPFDVFFMKISSRSKAVDINLLFTLLAPPQNPVIQ
ncbi:hypothetical protein [Labrenzia sp. THAF82]|uniref:hypothetical protein n=1 Tax=Labrenzia sp. THAF82 TaxID=2587861 RepID=UPI0012690830|nr:hypothetical protein [Labrenzia sp. THAF82]